MTRRHDRVWRLLLSGTVFALLLTGCDDPQTRDLITRRQGNLAWTLNSLRKTESNSSASMAWTLEQMREQCNSDRDNTSKNPSRIKAEVRREFNQWNENQPAYNNVIKEQLQGNPDTIRHTAPKLVW
jgi:hypothetical protein